MGMTTHSWLLSLTWLLPLGTAALFLLIPERHQAAFRRISLLSNTANLVLILFLTTLFAWMAAPAVEGSTLTVLQFRGEADWLPALGVRYIVGVDGISILMMLLAAVLMVCGTMVSWKVNDRAREFFVLLHVLAAGVFGSFISFDLFVFNEITIIPAYLLIAVFGSGRKEYAAMKLTLMLVGASTLILLGILGLYFESGLRTFDLLALSQVKLPLDFQLWAFPALFLGFGMLGALFPFHVWSPDGHSSAPTAVSMFLAGVHMKLGGYGCLRIAMYLLPEGAAAWMDIFLVLATAGVVWGGLTALRQRDLKYLNAYSSVSHCGLVLFGFAVLNHTSVKGAVLQMLAHGFLTALFFALIGMIYSRTHTRMVDEMGGLRVRMPFLGGALAITGFAALGLPGLAAFPAEFTLFFGGLSHAGMLQKVCTLLAISSIVVTAVYILRAVNGVLHGPQQARYAKVLDATWMERVPVILLVVCLLAMGLYPAWWADLIGAAVEPIVNNVLR